jgi:oligopeptide transport system substrate-binding protein
MPGLRWKVLCAFLMTSIVGAAAAPSTPKILRITHQSIGGDAIDPAQLNSVLIAHLMDNLIEPMLRYDYLARPLKLVPNTVTELPEASEAGRVYLCHIKPGIFFAPDPVFKGKPRELVAADYAYSIRRLFDPRWKSSQLFIVDGKIAGADALRKAALAGKPFDYDKPIAGLAVVDRYTLRITLNEPDLNFLHVLAQQNLGAVAREVVEAYGDDIGQHPVGTGPYYLVERAVGSRLVFSRNPNYRDEVFEGRKLPMIDRVELSYIVEDQPIWLAFLARDLDMIGSVPVSFRLQAVPNGKLAPNLARQGIVLHSYVYPAIWFDSFNMKDPVVGGYGPDRVALRRAIALAFDRRQAIDIIFNGGAIAANGIVPTGIAGHDPEAMTTVFDHDIAKAKALLDMHGYVDRDGDGWREAPDGSPLSIGFASVSQPRFRAWDELWDKAFRALGIRMVLTKMHNADLTKMVMAGKHQLAMNAWNMDYPDGEDFYVLLYGPASGSANQSFFELPAYDRLYDQARLLHDSPERNRLYREMDKLTFAYMPMVMNLYPVRAGLTHPWVKGYVPNPAHLEPWKYLDIDMALRARALGGR